MNFQDKDYNTSRTKLKNAEFGRHLQEYVNQVIAEPDKAKRTRMAYSLVNSLSILNAGIKTQANWEEKLWGIVLRMGGKEMDIEAPYPMPEDENIEFNPERISYSDSKIRFRFYGRNLQLLIEEAGKMEEGTEKQVMVNMIASFMFNSSKSWNNENLSNQAIADHLKMLSNNKLEVDSDSIEVSPEAFVPRPNNQQNQQRRNQGNNKNNRFGNNNQNKRKNNNFRRY